MPKSKKTFLRSFLPDGSIECSWYDKNGKRYLHRTSSYTSLGLSVKETDDGHGYMAHAREHSDEFDIYDDVDLPHPSSIKAPSSFKDVTKEKLNEVMNSIPKDAPSTFNIWLLSVVEQIQEQINRIDFEIMEWRKLIPPEKQSEYLKFEKNRCGQIEEKFYECDENEQEERRSEVLECRNMSIIAFLKEHNLLLYNNNR